jgi:N-dimethylarginine dimethylaminohydrolase
MIETPSQLPIPSYVMNFPFSLDTKNPNNIWMNELSEEELKINRPKAYKQFMDVYNFIAGGGLVYILPSEGNYQDQVYVANLGIYLPHIEDSNNIILSNYKSEPRRGEENVGEAFFNLMNYKTHKSPYHWEGEADLKFLRNNVYIGGYNMRSDIKSYEWMEEKFNMNIIKVEMVDEYLYHLDCSIFPLDSENTLICKDFYDKEEIKQIEKHTNIIDIPEDLHYYDITNCVRYGNMVLGSTFIHELKKDHEWYEGEKNKINFMEKVCYKLGLEPVFFNISEYAKSGAALSCMVMNLNYIDQQKKLI